MVDIILKYCFVSECCRKKYQEFSFQGIMKFVSQNNMINKKTQTTQCQIFNKSNLFNITDCETNFIALQKKFWGKNVLIKS